MIEFVQTSRQFQVARLGVLRAKNDCQHGQENGYCNDLLKNTHRHVENGIHFLQNLGIIRTREASTEETCDDMKHVLMLRDTGSFRFDALYCS